MKDRKFQLPAFSFQLSAFSFPRRPIFAIAGHARRVSNWLSIRNEDAATGPVELLIYDQIGKDWWDDSGVDAKTFAETLQAIPAHRNIVVALNSPGGNVWDGLAIYHQLQQRKDRVTTRVDGIAASIASVIALAGHETTMPKNALMMIHDPSGLVVGTADDMRQLANELDKHADVLADIYATKSGAPANGWRRKMRAETWFTGAEAREAGLADTVLDEVTVTANFDLSRCRHVPAALQKNNARSNRPPPTPPDPMKRTELIALFASLSAPVAADAADAILLAELQKLFAAGKVTAEKFEELTGQKPVAPAPGTAPASGAPSGAPAAAPAPAPTNVVSREEFEAMQKKLKAEQDRRVTAELDQLIAANPNIDKAEWLPRVLADESLLATLKKLPKPMPGAEPIKPSLANLGNPVLAEYEKKKPGAEREEFRLRNFEAIQRAHRQFAPRGANTLAAALITDWLADGLIVVANNKLAALMAFSRDFGVDPLKPRAKVQVRKASAASAAQTNPTNFETGDSTVDAVAVTVNQISKSFQITNTELNQGFRLQDLAKKNAHIFANTISDVWTALILDATFAAPAALNIGAATAFDQGELATIYGTGKNFTVKNLVLDGSYVGRIVTTVNPFAFKNAPQGDRGAFGFDVLAEQNRWTGADLNTVGVVCAPDAIAVASGLPMELPAGEFLELGTVALEGIGATVQTAAWFSRAGRVHWASYDIMFGAAAGDTTQLARLKSA